LKFDNQECRLLAELPITESLRETHVKQVHEDLYNVWGLAISGKLVHLQIDISPQSGMNFFSFQQILCVVLNALTDERNALRYLSTINLNLVPFVHGWKLEPKYLSQEVILHAPYDFLTCGEDQCLFNFWKIDDNCTFNLVKTENFCKPEYEKIKLLKPCLQWKIAIGKSL
jgi:hypothetical protein